MALLPNKFLPTTLLSATAVLPLLSGCEHYSVAVNDRNVYTPPPIITKVKATDPALQACLLQTLKEQRISDANKLYKLNCSSAGIVSLQGLEQFRQLTHINFNDNNITDLSVMYQLNKLQVLALNNNPLEDLAPLMDTLTLKQVYLQGTASDCSEVKKLAQWSEITETECEL